MLVLLNLLFSFLHLDELLFEALLLFFAALLKLDFCLGQACLLLNQSCNNDDLMLLDIASRDLVIKGFGLDSYLCDLFLVLSALILKLLDFTTHGSCSRLQLVTPLSLLFNPRLKLGNFLLVVLLLVLELEGHVVLVVLLLEFLESGHRLRNCANVRHEDVAYVV